MFYAGTSYLRMIAPPKIKLGILNQPIVRKSGSASDVITETIAIVKLAEQLRHSRV